MENPGSFNDFIKQSPELISQDHQEQTEAYTKELIIHRSEILQVQVSQIEGVAA